MKYDLVFEGGGAKGMVFVGAMQVFESLGHTPGRLLGTSAGAITAALLAAGYSSPEMLEALAEKKDGRSVFSDFLGAPQEFDKAAIRTSATRALLRNINLPLIPDRFEDVLDDRLVVEGQDQGRGFDIAEVPDPRQDECLLKTSGRGLFLVRCFADELKVKSGNNGGATVLITKLYSNNSGSKSSKEKQS